MTKSFRIPRVFRLLTNYFPGFLLIFLPVAVNAQCPGIGTGYTNPAVAVNTATTGTEAWNNPGNALSDNNSYATISNAALLIGGTVRTSNFLVIRNLGFSLPNNAQICGVQVEIRRLSSDNSGSNYTRDLDIRLLKNNQVTGTNHANTGVNWTTSETASTYGSNADLWGNTLTGFDVSSNGFGVAISIQSRAAGLLLPTVISYIDAVRVRIYYYTPFVDIDGDGIADLGDSDMDGDGLPNSQELIVCNSPSDLALTATTDPSLTSKQAAAISMNASYTATAGAGVSGFGIAENYPALSGPEIKITQDVLAAADLSTVFLKFNSPVHNLRFSLQDVDLGGQFQDNVKVDAYSGNQLITLTAANFTIGPGNFNAFIGSNSFAGYVPMNDNEMDGTIAIHIPDLVDSVKIIFINADLANLGSQDIGIGQISWCNPKASLQDIDGDGQPGFRDADSDNDGIPDLREIQPATGFITLAGLDSDNDGIDNAFDAGTGGVSLVAIDTDSDGIPDYNDTDSDNDGNSDLVEGNDLNHDCTADFALSGTDTDGDGLDNSFDINNGGTAAPRQDADNNGVPDYRQHTVPDIAVAGIDQEGNSVSFTLNANAPTSGLGYWNTVTGTGGFSNINDPAASVTGLTPGTNSYAWTIYTDGCHVSGDTVAILQLLPLPVIMSALIVTTENKKAVLRWNTYTEQNNRGFGIMHSTDGSSWQQLEFIPSLAPGGNSSSVINYVASQQQPANGRNYYRLAQQDMDGKIAYSNIESLLFAKQHSLLVYPNPVTDAILLSNADAQNIKLLKLLDAGGKIVFLSNKAVITNIDMTCMAKGSYFLQVLYKDGTERSAQVLKQ